MPFLPPNQQRQSSEGITYCRPTNKNSSLKLQITDIVRLVKSTVLWILSVHQSYQTQTQTETDLFQASSISPQLDATRICCWAPATRICCWAPAPTARRLRYSAPAAIDRCSLAGRALSSKPTARRWCCRSRKRRADRQMRDHYIDPALHTTQKSQRARYYIFKQARRQEMKWGCFFVKKSGKWGCCL